MFPAVVEDGLTLPHAARSAAPIVTANQHENGDRRPVRPRITGAPLPPIGGLPGSTLTAGESPTEERYQNDEHSPWLPVPLGEGTPRRLRTVAQVACATGADPFRRTGRGLRTSSIPAGNSPTSAVWSKAAIVTRLEPIGTWVTWTSPRLSGSTGARKTCCSSQLGSSRSSVRSRLNGVAEAHACGRARGRVDHRRGELLAPEAAEELGQPAVEGGRGVDHALCNRLGLLDEAVAHEPRRADGAVVGPDRSVVVAHRVVRAHRAGERADAPAREQSPATAKCLASQAARARRRRSRSTGSDPCWKSASRSASCRRRGRPRNSRGLRARTAR